MHIFSYRGAAHKEVRRSSKFDDFCPAALSPVDNALMVLAKAREGGGCFTI